MNVNPICALRNLRALAEIGLAVLALSIVDLPCSFNLVSLVSAQQTQSAAAAIQEEAIQEEAIQVSESSSVESVRLVLTKYCGQCHQAGRQEGDFALTQLDEAKSEKSVIARWEQVAEAIADDKMPPEDSPQPNRDEKDLIIAWIKTNATAPTGSKSLRRMNRIEYENTIRDLFRLSRDGFANPSRVLRNDDYFDPQAKQIPRYVFAVSHFTYPDLQRSELLGVSTPPTDLPAEHGFTNDINALQFTPLLAEKYIQMSQEVVGSPTLRVISNLWMPLFAVDSAILNKHDDPGVNTAEAQTRLAEFLPRAFRRPVSRQEIQRYVDVFSDHFVKSNSFTTAMKATVSAVLISSDFMFLFQPSSDESLTIAQRQSIRNASRLSYFLWASMPDDQLLDLAQNGELTTPQQLQAQARRMLLSKKVKTLATDFGMQWLKVNRLTSSQPDAEKFPSFFTRKKQPIGIAMMIEQLLFFEAILVEDRSILEFISADFAYLNRDLLEWYGLRPQKYVGFEPSDSAPEDFFRVRFSGADLRGGVITAGSTLVLTSTSLRTSPVFRGAWIAETIFNRPPPPPPANVPALEKIGTDEHGKVLSPREKLAIHRDDPNCRSCHSRMDPLGFGLEQFDAVGKIRQTYENGDTIDASGQFTGEAFSNAIGLKQMILRNKETFVRAFVGHTLRYAINRQLTLVDADEIDRITKAVIADDCRFHAVIDHVVASSIFCTPIESGPVRSAK